MNYCCGSKTSRCANLLRKQNRNPESIFCVSVREELIVNMNSALKPALGGAGVPASGQASPAKGNVAGVNHAAVLPQGANSHHNSLVGQNLSQHAPPPQAPPHAVPSMAPVSANMAQMAQNMSHHGNLSHLNQNSAPANLSAAPSPSKVPSTSSPLSLVQDKVVVNASQPLALTRTPEKKESDSGHANGTIDSPKSAANAPAALKPQNPEPNKDKQDIAKTSPSTPKPPEKPVSAPIVPQKPEGAAPAPASQAELPALPKVVKANDPPEKSPLKPAEPTPAPTADVAPPQSDSKPVPESANNQSTSQATSQPASLPAVTPVSQPEKAPTPVKQDPPAAESVKPEAPKVEEKKEEAPVKPPITEEKKEEVKEKVESPKKEDQVDSKPPPPKVEEKVEEKKEVKKLETRPKSTLKLATVTPPMRKRRHVSPAKTTDGPSPAKKTAEGDATPSDSRTKRNRTKVQLYQSPTPELAMATKLSASAGRSTPTKPNDDKLIVFYKNEYLAVRNAEGGFYVCQAIQNVYRTTRKIKIRWLSQDKSDPKGETYKPDFYDTTDMECVLTTLSLSRGGGGAQVLSGAEAARASSILERALRAEQGAAGSLDLTPEHPDGLDLSLYKDESQLDKKSRKRSARQSPQKSAATASPQKEAASPPKKARITPKRSPKSARLSKTTVKPITPTNNNKRKSPGSTPVVATTSKTATAVTEKAKSSPAKPSPKRSPALAKKADTPVATPTRGRRATKDTKPSPIVSTPSTSTGKATRTPRKPPSRK